MRNRLTPTLVLALALCACGEGVEDPNPPTDGAGEVPEGAVTSQAAALYAGAAPLLSTIRVLSSNQCLTAKTDRSVRQEPCGTGSDQKWRIRPVAGRPGYFELLGWTLVTGGMCLDLPGGSSAVGQDLQIFPCHGGPNQQFLVRSTATGMEILPDRTRQCLDIEWGDNVVGRRLQQFTCHGGRNQRFALSVTPTLLQTRSHSCSARSMRWQYPGPTNYSFDRGDRGFGYTTGYYEWMCHYPNRDSSRCPGGTDLVDVQRSASSDTFWVRCYDDNDELIAPVTLDDTREGCDDDNDLIIQGAAGNVVAPRRGSVVVPVGNRRFGWLCGRFGVLSQEWTTCPTNTNEVEITRRGDDFDVECRAN